MREREFPFHCHYTQLIVVAALANFSACGDDGATCDLNQVAADMIAAAPVTECGDFGVTATVDELLAAHDCVLDAVAAESTFLVRWQGQGIDSLTTQAFVGVSEETGFQSYLLVFDDMGDATPVRRWKCIVLVDNLASCPGAIENRLCLDCQHDNRPQDFCFDEY